ncbi:anti-sigma factor [Thermocoleostomius sinensis]|uniref:Anti-sigma factor n=1 Tax=Thermocoleostomius sinensis A174 TaxID=2016057 RepID=A0A9E8ZCF2_9CYAN|nr:anti-sigma factor [Thermocoleostomius sinensis]WAL59292.1 anti-sigma factor [Thermocoleostomius sinensis A174]
MTHSSHPEYGSEQWPEYWQELMAGYALGNLSSDEAEELQQLLNTHPALIVELDRFQAVLNLVPYALPDPKLPPSLRDNLLEAVRSGDTNHRVHSPYKASSRFSLVRMGGAVAAVLVLALAIDNYRLRQTIRSNDAIIASLQQPNAQVFALQGTENARDARGRLVVDPDNQSAIVLVQNLPPLPTGEAYRLWALADGDTQPVYCGEFNLPSSQSTAQWKMPTNACSANVSQMLITAESTAAPPVPAGPLVLRSDG